MDENEIDEELDYEKLYMDKFSRKIPFPRLEVKNVIVNPIFPEYFYIQKVQVVDDNFEIKNYVLNEDRARLDQHIDSFKGTVPEHQPDEFSDDDESVIGVERPELLTDYFEIAIEKMRQNKEYNVDEDGMTKQLGGITYSTRGTKESLIANQMSMSEEEGAYDSDERNSNDSEDEGEFDEDEGEMEEDEGELEEDEEEPEEMEGGSDGSSEAEGEGSNEISKSVSRIGAVEGESDEAEDDEEAEAEGEEGPDESELEPEQEELEDEAEGIEAEGNDEGGESEPDELVENEIIAEEQKIVRESNVPLQAENKKEAKPEEEKPQGPPPGQIVDMGFERLTVEVALKKLAANSHKKQITEGNLDEDEIKDDEEQFNWEDIDFKSYYVENSGVTFKQTPHVL